MYFCKPLVAVLRRETGYPLGKCLMEEVGFVINPAVDGAASARPRSRSSTRGRSVGSKVWELEMSL